MTFLCKYRPDDDRTLQILEDARFWLPSCVDFNDPFDGKTPLKLAMSKSQLKARLVDALVAEGRSRKQAIEEYKKLRDTDFIEEFARNEGQKVVRQIVENLGVLCLSKTNQSLLLWSHYANGHRGVCLMFDDPAMIAAAQEVHYDTELPDVNYFQASKEEVTRATILWKSLDWVYEQEMRIVMPNRAHTYYDFPRERLAAVIIGCWSERGKFRTRLCEIVRTKYPGARLLLARKDRHQFGVGFDEYTGD